jgi:hypothetical protein
MQGPDPRRRARREVVAALIGAEVGAALGLVVLGGIPLAPLGMVVLCAAAGAGLMHARHTLFRRWLRSQLRAAR